MSARPPLSLSLSLFLFTFVSSTPLSEDWLVSDLTQQTQPFFRDNSDGSWTLGNNLVSRTFRYGGPPGSGFGTIDFRSEMSDVSMIRAIDVEGYLSLDGKSYCLGSLIQTGTTYHAYLNRSAMGINFNPDGWDAVGHAVGAPQAPFPWAPGTRGSPATAQWPPAGLQVAFQLAPPASAPAAHQAVSVQLVYEIYPNIPLITKWVTVASKGPAAAGVVVTGLVPESVRLARQYSPFALGAQSPAGAGTWAPPPSLLYVQTDAAHGSQIQFLHDGAEPTDPGAVECRMLSNYSLGPGVVLRGGSGGGHGPHHHTPLHATLVGGGVAELVSFRTFELVTDSSDPERVGMGVKRLYRLWAPHAQENPIFFHATNSTDAGFRLEVDQLAAVGFEMLM